ncbi:MAG: family 78 glycoside hydrolase catalytic domain [Clostridia bacterium]|nr:family 78 glycoside hydrolase catalytic domain [Clostridia bacterium]
MIWIHSPIDTDEQAVYFKKNITWSKTPVKVEVTVTAIGIYNLLVDGKKVGKQVLTPGWTSYFSRVQTQTYDITGLGSEIAIEVGAGWAVGTIGFSHQKHRYDTVVRAAAEITATFADGTTETVTTDESWDCWSHPVLTTDIYNGETWDGTHEPALLGKAVRSDVNYTAIPQVGEYITTQERLKPIAVITTPKGEKVLDFGQNMTGWIELKVQGKKGDVIAFDHAEVLDKEGNFYTENYRSAKAYAKFILSGEEEILAPHFTFYGFRYIRLLECPAELGAECFTAVVVHSDMKRTGDFQCGHPLLTQLYHNIIWGQKSNYLDVPTDCPQRDERLGWTGDAQVFCRTAAINYDVEKFFKKWLGDVALEQWEDGAVEGVVPIALVKGRTRISAAWGDVACIAPWEIYKAYGNKEMLRDHFPMMKKWVDYMHNAGSEEFLWLDGKHYGDWLAMDAGDGIYMGATPTHMIGTAFFAFSCSLVVKAGKVLGEDVSDYEELYQNVVAKFRECYIENGTPVERGAALKNVYPIDKKPPVINPDTQTARVLMLHFNLCTEEDRPKLAKQLADMVVANGTHLTTGFVGTPYLLHVLSSNGYAKLAYDLLLQETFPSWLFSVKQGATTMWEHWDGIKEDGSFWSKDMNSYNHYAYGSVFDWIFGVAGGITVDEDGPAYEKVTVAPVPDARLGYLTTSIETRRGKLLSHWEYRGEQVLYRFEIPAGTTATIILPDGRTETVTEGTYMY